MTPSKRWTLAAAALGMPLVTMSVYLLWIWPRPRGTSALADTIPYALCLLTGLPFAWKLASGSGRVLLVIVYLVSGFGILWIYALAVLCGVRGVCL